MLRSPHSSACGGRIRNWSANSCKFIEKKGGAVGSRPRGSASSDATSVTHEASEGVAETELRNDFVRGRIRLLKARLENRGTVAEVVDVKAEIHAPVVAEAEIPCHAGRGGGPRLEREVERGRRQRTADKEITLHIHRDRPRGQVRA